MRDSHRRENQINLAAGGAEIGRQKFQAELLQMPLRRAFAEFAAPQMLRLRVAGEPRPDFFK
jgi:hypothetical protein